MKLFQDHQGGRVAIQFSDKQLKIDGFVMGIENDCVKLSSSPEGKGAIRFLPWPNANVAYVEFLASSSGVY